MISVIPLLRSAVSGVSGKEQQMSGPKEQNTSSVSVTADSRKGTLSPKFAQYAKTVLSLTAFMIASSVLIFINKRVSKSSSWGGVYVLGCGMGHGGVSWC